MKVVNIIRYPISRQTNYQQQQGQDPERQYFPEHQKQEDEQLKMKKKMMTKKSLHRQLQKVKLMVFYNVK